MVSVKVASSDHPILSQRLSLYLTLQMGRSIQYTQKGWDFSGKVYGKCKKFMLRCYIRNAEHLSRSTHWWFLHLKQFIETEANSLISQQDHNEVVISMGCDQRTSTSTSLWLSVSLQQPADDSLWHPELRSLDFPLKTSHLKPHNSSTPLISCWVSSWFHAVKSV